MTFQNKKHSSLLLLIIVWMCSPVFTCLPNKAALGVAVCITIGTEVNGIIWQSFFICWIMQVAFVDLVSSLLGLCLQKKNITDMREINKKLSEVDASAGKLEQVNRDLEKAVSSSLSNKKKTKKFT